MGFLEARDALQLQDRSAGYTWLSCRWVYALFRGIAALNLPPLRVVMTDERSNPGVRAHAHAGRPRNSTVRPCTVVNPVVPPTGESDHGQWGRGPSSIAQDECDRRELLGSG